MEHRNLSRNIAALNIFLNHSAVHPNIAPDGTGYIDATELFQRKGTYFFNFGWGALLFILESDNVYKLDAYFPRKRGADAKAAIIQGIQYMFDVAGAGKIIAEAPSFNKPSQMMIASLGFQRSGISRNAWSKGGILYDVVSYEMGIDGKHRFGTDGERIK